MQKAGKREEGKGKRLAVRSFGALICCLLGFVSGAALAHPFADAVLQGSYLPGPGQFVNNSLYNDPSRAIGRPYGEYINDPDNTSVVTLGDGGKITLVFNEPVTDDPKNPYGLDFIVFSNANMVGGNPEYRWQELAFVEISPDGTNWYLILPNILPAALVGGTDTGQSRTVVNGYAEYTPTIGLPQDLDPVIRPFPVSRTPEELYTVPERPSIPGDADSIGFDFVSGGGDAFDIADAVVQSSPGVPARDAQNQTIPASITSFRYVRLTDAKTGDFRPGLGEISAEIDAAADVRPAVSIGEAKALPDGAYAVITDAIVTAVSDEAFFVQAENRSAAIKATSTLVPAVGDKLTITGHISNSGGACSIPDPMFTAVSPGNDLPRPLGAPIVRLSSDLSHGLRVRTWGKVIDPGDGYYCVISDGGASAKITCPDCFEVQQNAWVSVTGARDREEGTGSILIRAASFDDITSY